MAATGGDGWEATSETSQPIPKTTSTASFEPTSLQLTKSQTKWKELPSMVSLRRSVQMVIRRKGKFGYLDGSISKPSSTDPSFQTWDVQNSIMMAWLIHSMDDSIGETYLFHPNAKDIWDAVSLAYFNFADSSQRDPEDGTLYRSIIA
ncbi:hypothetical protein DH2020_020219 [Rehmannia glutinosa]|uniref:Retrotransposon Copia-like N-terminal domain-containing protein n=1 Tax=Rehmannia glutinosa TaxID=99300 RepID=A0ABR0WJM8_REHGL